MAGTKYARSGDLHIAYRVIGDGPMDLVKVPSWFSHIEAYDAIPQFTAFSDRLASFSRVIMFDKRGTGMSDPLPTDAPPTIEERMDDLRSVLDAVGSERAALMGSSEGGPIAMTFAASAPHRTQALILWGTFSRLLAAPDYPDGLDPGTVRGFAEAISTVWGEGLTLQFMAPSIADDERARERYGRFERLGASPALARILLELNAEIDVRHVLSTISVPTLVLHRRDEIFIGVEHGRYTAEHIPGARLLELPGADHLPWVGDYEVVVGEIEEFLTGVRRQPEPDRILATVMFVDIVDSTKLAASLGDRPWKNMLDEFFTLARGLLDRFHGREVNSTGDGFLATFDGPARAIRCATTLRDAVRSQGVDIRAGLHTGECELTANGIGGIAVHIGARVSAQAGPGEVFVSSTVKDLVAGSGLTFADRGERTLKGVPDSWRLFAVT